MAAMLTSIARLTSKTEAEAVTQQHAAAIKLKIGVVGGLSLSIAGSPLVLPNRKARALLAFLALEDAPSFPRERLAGLFWAESGDVKSRSSLRTTLHELRKALLARGCAVLHVGQEEVSLSRDMLFIDIDTALRTIADGGVPEGLVTQPRAVALLLAGYEDLTDEFRGWVERMRNSAQARLARALEQAYDDQSLPRRHRRMMAEAALRLDPLDESACRTVMRLAAESGEIGIALRAYAALYDALGTELDMEPSDSTQALVAAIKSGNLLPAPAPALPMPPAAQVTPAVAEASIVVMPFEAHDPVAMNFAEGVVEGIVHVLSGIGDLFVIAHGTARSYAGRSRDPRDIGRDLGVAYVLCGRVAQSAEGMRVFTELAETGAGRVIRTERHQATQDTLFALQDRIATDVVAIIAPAVREHELARAKRKPPGTLTAYDLMLQGVELQYELSERSFAQAGAHLYEAIALDPFYAPAYAYAATWHNFRIGQGWSPDPGEDAAHAARCAAKALEHDRNNAVALAIQGQVLSFHKRDYAAARSYLDRATALGPSSVLAWTLSSATHSWSGCGRLGVEHATRALRLSPLDPFVFFTEHMLSQGHYVCGDYPEAIRWALSAASQNPRLTSNLRTLTAALVAAGDLAAAREVGRQVLVNEPNFNVATFAQRTPLAEVVRCDYVARLRLAGLPD